MNPDHDDHVFLFFMNKIFNSGLFNHYKEERDWIIYIESFKKRCRVDDNFKSKFFKEKP